MPVILIGALKEYMVSRPRSIKDEWHHFTDYAYWYHRPPMGGFDGWQRPPMHHHYPMGGFGDDHVGGKHVGSFGGAFGDGGRTTGGGAGLGRH